MSYSIGFDLGTHQTKICIQDATNPEEKIYEFLEFEKPKGKPSVLFPSVVQINTDGTVSYGFVNEQQCLKLDGIPTEEPLLQLKERPLLPQLPEKKQTNYPKKPIVDWKEKLAKIGGKKTSIDRWKDECAKIDAEYIKKWKKLCDIIMEEYNRICESIDTENSYRRIEYEEELTKWKKTQEKERCCFRYFKLHAFTDSRRWENSSFSAQEITVWYIAYLLIKLREKLGNNFPVQFGTPTSWSTNSRNDEITKRAYSLYIAAYKLSIKYSDINVYLKATYKELRNYTEISCVIDDIKNEYFFDDLPEAFAGLTAVTTQKKLGAGFHLLTDIGGGTTDMAMFFVDHKTLLPDVILVSSFTKGLNFVFEQTQIKVNKSLNDLQELFFKNSDSTIFENAVEEYKKNLKEKGSFFERSLFERLNWQKEYHGIDKSTLINAIKDQPIIYCGGGSLYTQLHVSIGNFTDLRGIDKEMLDIEYVRNRKRISDELYPILAVSYGLASFEKPYDGIIKQTDISVIFEKIKPREKDMHNLNRYEHGLLDD